MSEYTPTFNKPYPDGWKDKPDETTPVTAEIMDSYDEVIENIETYLSENPISESGGGENNGDIDLTDLVVENSISMGRTGEVGAKSVAMGDFCEASGACSHAEGFSTKAKEINSHAEGSTTHAEGDTSHAEGYATVAKGAFQHVQGKYNIVDIEDKYAHIVGGGTSNGNRKNIHTLDWEGNAMYAGTIESQGLILTDTATEQKYKLTIANGNIEITAVD